MGGGGGKSCCLVDNWVDWKFMKPSGANTFDFYGAPEKGCIVEGGNFLVNVVKYMTVFVGFFSKNIIFVWIYFLFICFKLLFLWVYLFVGLSVYLVIVVCAMSVDS